MKDFRARQANLLTSLLDLEGHDRIQSVIEQLSQQPEERQLPHPLRGAAKFLSREFVESLCLGKIESGN